MPLPKGGGIFIYKVTPLRGVFRVRLATKKKEAYASPFSRASRSRFSGSVSWSSASANLRYAVSIASDIVCPFQLAISISYYEPLTFPTYFVITVKIFYIQTYSNFSFIELDNFRVLYGKI